MLILIEIGRVLGEKTVSSYKLTLIVKKLLTREVSRRKLSMLIVTIN